MAAEDWSGISAELATLRKGTPTDLQPVLERLQRDASAEDPLWLPFVQRMIEIIKDAVPQVTRGESSSKAVGTAAAARFRQSDWTPETVMNAASIVVNYITLAPSDARLSQEARQRAALEPPEPGRERRQRTPRLHAVEDPAPPTSLHRKAIVQLQEAVRRAFPDAFSDPRLAAQARSTLARAVNNTRTLVLALDVAADAQLANSSNRYQLRRVARRVERQAELMASAVHTLSRTTSLPEVRLLLRDLLAAADEIMRDLDEVASAVS